MVTLAQIRKQIHALETQAAEITKAEMAGAVAKVKALMSTYGLTAEHLGLGGSGGAVAPRPMTAAKKATRAKRAGAGQAKYRDPATGATWTGFGRAPSWIAGAQSRDAFLIDQGSPSGASQPAKAAGKKAVSKKASIKPAAKKASAASKKAAPSKKTSKAAAKSAVRSAKKAARPVAVAEPASEIAPPAKKLPAKKASAKTGAKKAAPKKAVPQKVASKKVASKKAVAKKVAPAKKAASKKAAKAAGPAPTPVQQESSSEGAAQ